MKPAGQSRYASPRETIASPPHRAAIVFARFLADLLDQRFTIPGTSIRIGLDPLISLIPGIGDAVANIAGSAILLIGARLGLPRVVLLRMGINIAVNTALGLIPIAGDIASIWFRSNVKNVELLELHASADTRSTAKDWFFVVVVIAVLLLLFAGSLAAIIFVIRRLAAAL